MEIIGITKPVGFSGESACLSDLLSTGLRKLHVRKPNAEERDLVKLLKHLPEIFYDRLVLHGDPALAKSFGIPQVHCSFRTWQQWEETGTYPEGIAVSISLHSWSELLSLKGRPAYAFISPLFNSVSKPGYLAGQDLLNRPRGTYPCTAVGLGGITPARIRVMKEFGWDHAAILGWLWEEPRLAGRRYEQLINSMS